jgi:hypothetical protein
LLYHRLVIDVKVTELDSKVKFREISNLHHVTELLFLPYRLSLIGNCFFRGAADDHPHWQFTSGRAAMSIAAKIDARRACRDEKPRRSG